jgi:hypothetical protein
MGAHVTCVGLEHTLLPAHRQNKQPLDREEAWGPHVTCMGLEHSHGSLLTDKICRYSHQTRQLSQDLALEGARSLADVRGWVPETARRTQGGGLSKRLPDQLQPLHQRAGLRPCASAKC